MLRLRTFMETNANGQVGGLETTDSARQQFALKSLKWTCPVCSKSNSDIIKECEKQYAATSKSLHTATGDVVPVELKMIMKEELVNSTPAGASSGETRLQPTVPQPLIASNVIADDIQSSSRHQPAQIQPRQRLTTETPAPSASAPRTEPLLVAVAQDTALSPPVPVWIDRAIVILAIILAVLLFKVMFAV